VREVLFGCVLQAVWDRRRRARRRSERAFPCRRCTTIHKVCGSAMKATMLAHDLLLAAATHHRRRRYGIHEQRPYLLPKARAGYRLVTAR